MTNEEQHKILDKINSFKVTLTPETSEKNEKIPQQSTANPFLKRPANDEESKVVLDDYLIEYSVSSRAECVGCRNKIMKGLIRVSKNMFFTEIGMRFGGQKFQHHLECFAGMCGDEYGFYLSADKIPGFKNLEAKDQKKAMEILIKTEVAGGKRQKIEATTSSNFDPTLENLIKSQTEKFQFIREQLKSSLDAKKLGEFLKLNNSKVVLGYENILDRCADFISFGAILKCTTCSNGDMIFSKYGYKCDGRLNEWADCNRFETHPQRQSVTFSKAMHNVLQTFESNGIKFDVQNRAVRPMATKIDDSKDTKRAVKVVRKREPFYNMHIVAVGQLSVNRAELKRRIESMGGKLVTKLQGQIAFVISDENEVEKMNKRMQQVKSFKIQVLTEDFIDKVENLPPEDVIEKIRTDEISDWGSDPLTRIPQEDANEYQVNFHSIFS